MHGFAAALMCIDDARTQLEYAERAMAIDPDFATAWVVSGIAHNDLGAHDKALCALGRALEISPASVDMYLDRALVNAAYGDAERTAADARQATALDPTRYGFDLLASAQYASGQSLESVRTTLKRKWACVPDVLRPSVEAHDEAQLAVLDGRVHDAGRLAEEASLAGKEHENADYHGPLVRVALQCALELGEEEPAVATAEAYLERHAGWNVASRVDRDPIPLAVGVLERAGRLPHGEAARKRSERAAANYAPSGVLWAVAFAPACDLAEVREEAAKRLDRGLALRVHTSPWHRADAGRLMFALGRTDDAVTLLRVASRSCVATFDALLHVYAGLWLAQALQARGDTDEAKAAYETVLTRWARAPHTSAVRTSRQALDALAVTSKA